MPSECGSLVEDEIQFLGEELDVNTEIGRCPSEEWRKVPGYEGLYIISNLGRVRGVQVNAPILSTRATDKDGYPIIALNRDGTRHSYALHRLVCRVFHGEPASPGLEAAHVDGDRKNFRADNLQWATKAENHAHKRAHGTHQVGDNAGHRKLTSGQVSSIRLARGIHTAAKLAELHGVSRHAIYDIWQNKRWSAQGQAS